MVVTGLVTVVLRVEVVLQHLRQLLFPPFLRSPLFPSFPSLCVPQLFPYTSRVLSPKLLVAPVFVLGCPCVLRVVHTGVLVSSFFIRG